MSYDFDPHRHVKIWLSKDKETFLNLENRARLVKMRDINPSDEISFIYDSQLLSANALLELHAFCARYQIVAKDLRDLFPQCQTDEEKKLISIYNEELDSLDAGGNMAVASDILRWLQPIYSLGTYTDFDVQIDTRYLPKTIPVQKPLLMALGSYALKGDVENIYLNNNTIAVVNSQNALSDIQKIQQSLYANCSKQDINQDNFIQFFIRATRRRLIELFPLFGQYMPVTNANILLKLSELTRGKSSLEMRREIITITNDNINFGKSFLSGKGKLDWNYDDETIIKKSAPLLREEYKSQLGFLNWLVLPKNQYNQIKVLGSIKDDNELLTRSREHNRMLLLKTSVVHTTGPLALLVVLFKKIFYKKTTVDSEIAPYSFSHYGLDKAFISSNNFSLHEKSSTVAVKMNSTVIGESNDLSWLEEGQNATVKRENKIREVQTKLPQHFQKMHDKIQDHIDKIEADLVNCFGFYRNRARHAKVDALKAILKHFNGQGFDGKGFNDALENYRSKDISASMGRSKTKELIDELEFFGKLAKHLMLTDEQGIVNMPHSPQQRMASGMN